MDINRIPNNPDLQAAEGAPGEAQGASLPPDTRIEKSTERWVEFATTGVDGIVRVSRVRRGSLDLPAPWSQDD